MTGKDADPNSETGDSRISSLEERLERAEAAEAKRTGADQPVADANERLGQRVLAELLGGMIGGALIGWVFDRFAQTAPWGMLGLLFVGIIVAFRNIIRLSKPGQGR